MYADNQPAFRQYVIDNIAKNFHSETLKYQQNIVEISIRNKELNNLLGIFNEFHIPYKINKFDSRTNIRYLEQFEASDIYEKQRNTIFNNKMFNIEYEFLKSESISNLNKNEFEELLISKQRTIFFIDQSNEQDVKNIVKYVFGIDVLFERMVISNEKYEIDGLSYFVIPDEHHNEIRNSERIHRYGFVGIMHDSGVEFFRLYDKNGSISVMVQFKPRNNNRKSVIKFRDDVKSPFRSSWEANIARVFNHLDIKWNYEKEFIQTEHGAYLPDFWLSDNKIIEVKGFWDYESRLKVSWFVNNINTYSLLLIDRDLYYDIYNSFKDVIPNFEDDTSHNPTKETVPVVGITIAERKKFVVNISEGDDLFLVRDPLNEYDKNAIKVVDLDKNHIGFISKEWAVIYSYKMDLGIKYKVTVKEKQPKVINVSVVRSNLEETILDPIFI
ncbi:HIRAN domain-containing protein [Paenibacillus sp. FSL H3-0333]|uniref:HIRAN domain-containing protein n=1 Tax=Paenibacillus sp. FSL H3-0333 TaxID=2921373 RepID=UPI0030FC9074